MQTSIMFVQKNNINDSMSIQYSLLLNPDYVVNTLIDFLKKNKDESQLTKTHLFKKIQQFDFVNSYGPVRKGFSYIVYEDNSIDIFENDKLMDKLDVNDFDELYHYNQDYIKE